MAANLLYPPGSSLSPEVLTSFVLPAHNQGVSYAPLQGHALWKIFLPTTGSFFVYCITDFFSVTAPFRGRFPVTLCLLLPAIMAGPSLPALPLKGSDRP